MERSIIGFNSDQENSTFVISDDLVLIYLALKGLGGEDVIMYAHGELDLKFVYGFSHSWANGRVSLLFAIVGLIIQIVI